MFSSSAKFGRAAGGTRPIVLLATFVDAAVPWLWLFAAPQRWHLLLVIHSFGVVSAPLAMGPDNFLLRLAPEKNAAGYLALFNSVVGTLSAVAAIIGGAIGTALYDWTWTVGPIEFGGLKAVFLLSAIGRLISIPLLFRIVESEAVDVLSVLSALRALQRPTTARGAVMPHETGLKNAA